MICSVAAVATLASCKDFLEPLPDGSYNEDNYKDYPTLVRGYIDKAYDLRPSSYYTNEFIGSDAAADDMEYRSRTGSVIKFANGSGQMTSYPFESLWTRDYQAIYYVNLFLKDDLGKNMRYLVDRPSDLVLRRCLQGDAFGLRAWYMFNLLEFFGGRGTNGEMLGVPIFTEPVDLSTFKNEDLKRASYDECVEQILADCDSAIKYLPVANRDQFYEGEPFHVTGAIRYRGLDQISIKALRAKVLLTWASPAFNPTGDKSRWEKAAKAAKEVIDHKQNVESTFTDGFKATASFSWNNPNTPEIVYLSNIGQNSSYETHFYPLGFGGSADIAPTQEFVDAFPMADGYPITESPSYDPTNPYAGRDPRFYENIFYNGCDVKRNQGALEIMYTFNCAEGGKDAPGGVQTSPTGYYARKYVYLGWNPNDAAIQTAQHCIFFFRWTHMCLIFAEAAANAGSPTTPIDGLTAKEALSYVRSRTTESGQPGVGAGSDPYLDECAANPAKFNALVKNEWRIETFLEGIRYHNLRRWATDVSDINVNVSRVVINGSTYTKETISTRKYPSLWNPIPYGEIRKASNMVQNEGWETWK